MSLPLPDIIYSTDHAEYIDTFIVNIFIVTGYQPYYLIDQMENTSSQSTATFGGSSEAERGVQNYLAAPAPGAENTPGSDSDSVHSVMTAALSEATRQRGAGAPAPVAVATVLGNGGPASADVPVTSSGSDGGLASASVPAARTASKIHVRSNPLALKNRPGGRGTSRHDQSGMPRPGQHPGWPRRGDGPTPSTPPTARTLRIPRGGGIGLG